MPSDELRHTMETCNVILERRRLAAQNCGEVHGRSSNHCQHTFPISSRSLTETRPWQGTSSAPQDLSAAEDPTAYRSLSAEGGAEDAAVLRSLADNEDAEVTAPGSSLALADEEDDTEVYALLEQADENLRYGALWAARLGLQQAMQRLGLESY